VELQTIPDCSFGIPCIDTNAFGPTQASLYWSSSSQATFPNAAWDVSFSTNDIVDVDFKDAILPARAVRGGR
jgi:hypothetical protein